MIYYVKLIKDKTEDEWRLWNPFLTGVYLDKSLAEEEVEYARTMKECWADVMLVEVEI